MSDEHGVSDTDSMNVQVEENSAPLVEARYDGDGNATAGTEFSLSAANPPDVDNDTLTHTWATVSSPDNATVDLGSNSSVVGASVDTAGEYEFEVTVEDEYGATSTDSVSVTVEEASEPSDDTGGDSGGGSTVNLDDDDQKTLIIGVVASLFVVLILGLFALVRGD